jgi:hypothetical protein
MTSTQTPERLSDLEFSLRCEPPEASRHRAGWVAAFAEAVRARAVESSQAEQLAALRAQLAETQAQEIAVRRSVRQVAERCRPGWVSEELDVIGAKTDAGRALLDRLERAEKRVAELERRHIPSVCPCGEPGCEADASGEYPARAALAPEAAPTPSSKEGGAHE